MRVIHNSRDSKYRIPFGAVNTGAELRISIEIEGQYPENVRMLLWKGENVQPESLTMHEESRSGDIIKYTVSFNAPDKGCLLWYAFEIEAADEYEERSIFYYGNNPERLGGEGRIYFDSEITAEELPAYQITVYKESKVPEWYRNGIVYQICPGRFARDEHWKERCGAAIEELNSRRNQAI